MSVAADRQREHDRNYQRRRHARALAEANRSATLCQKRFGAGRCGARLEDVMLPGGRVVLVCARCERYAAGLCRDCPAPRDRVRSPRCAACRRTALRRNERATRRRHGRTAEAERVRRLYHTDPAFRARRQAAARAWSRAHPDYRRPSRAVAAVA